MPTFTPHQDAALKAVADWLKAKPGRAGTPPVFRLFGFAGTGKTTLARHIAEGVEGEVKFAAFTGKAALVMRNKGCDGASTIHSLIYRAKECGVEQPSFELWDDAPASKAKLIVIDECSMVDEELGRDLMSFDCPLLVLGDPAQLPPIQGGGFFTNCEPDVMLTEVHRQAQDDPIVRLSMVVREGRSLELGQLRRQPGDPPRRSRSRPRAGRRPGAGRPQQHAARLQHAGAAEAEHRRPVAGRRRQAGLPAQQPQEGAVQRRAVAGEARAASKSQDHHHAARRRTRISAARRHQGLGARRNASAAHRGDLDWPQRKNYDEFDYGYVLTVHKSQGLAMGRRRAVRRELRLPGQPRALALHRHHPRREAALRGGVVVNAHHNVIPGRAQRELRANPESRNCCQERFRVRPPLRGGAPE